MSRAEEFETLREQGLTYQQIAEQCGVSHQYVSQVLAGSIYSKFRTVSAESVAFDGLRSWMNENKVGVMSLMKRIYGKSVNGGTAAAMRLKFKGKAEFRKSDIDALIRVTGRTYEELFGVEGVD